MRRSGVLPGTQVSGFRFHPSYPIGDVRTDELYEYGVTAHAGSKNRFRENVLCGAIDCKRKSE